VSTTVLNQVNSKENYEEYIDGEEHFRTRTFYSESERFESFRIPVRERLPSFVLLVPMLCVPMLCVPLLVSWGNVQTLCVDSLTAGAVVQCVPTQSVGTRSHPLPKSLQFSARRSGKDAPFGNTSHAGMQHVLERRRLVRCAHVVDQSPYCQ